MSYSPTLLFLGMPKTSEDAQQEISNYSPKLLPYLFLIPFLDVRRLLTANKNVLNEIIMRSGHQLVKPLGINQ